MATRIVINDKEVTNPVAKVFLIAGAIIIAALVSAFVIFILLPIIGVAVTLSVGFIVIFIAASIISAATLAFAIIIMGWLFGAAEFRFEKTNKK